MSKTTFENFKDRAADSRGSKNEFKQYDIAYRGSRHISIKEINDSGFSEAQAALQRGLLWLIEARLLLDRYGWLRESWKELDRVIDKLHGTFEDQLWDR